MKPLFEFVKMILVGGLLVVLPLWVSLLLLFKAVKGALAVLKPIVKLVPQRFVHDDVVALCLLVLICFVVGLVVRTELGKRIGDWLEQHLLGRLPGFSIIRGMIGQFAGEKDAQSFQPALVEIEEALVPAFIIEKHTDGQFTVFVSSSPTPMAGAIYILQPERVHPVNVPLRKAMVCVTKWGAGAAEMRSAMRPQKVKED